MYHCCCYCYCCCSGSSALHVACVHHLRLFGVSPCRVIIYDRFGAHHAFIQDLLHLPGIDYYPYTVYELAQPSKYNLQYLRKQGTDLKSFYKTEANWGYTSKKVRANPRCAHTAMRRHSSQSRTVVGGHGRSRCGQDENLRLRPPGIHRSTYDALSGHR